MRVVLYADDMEPITVFDLPESANGYLAKHRRFRVAVMEPLSLIAEAADKPPVMPRTVDIWAEQFERKGTRHLVLFTSDEEAALMLRSELLPGQRAGVQEQQRNAYARGFFAGLMRAIG